MKITDTPLLLPYQLSAALMKPRRFTADNGPHREAQCYKDLRMGLRSLQSRTASPSLWQDTSDSFIFKELLIASAPRGLDHPLSARNPSANSSDDDRFANHWGIGLVQL